MRTEIQVRGANCPECFNDVLRRLRGVEGVESVHGSIHDECIAVVHDALPVDALTAVARTRLRGVALASNETVMVDVDAHAAELGCPHR